MSSTNNDNNNNDNDMGSANDAGAKQASGNARGSHAQGRGGRGGLQRSSQATVSNQQPLNQGAQGALVLRPRGGMVGRGGSVQSGRVVKMVNVKYAISKGSTKNDLCFEVAKARPRTETLPQNSAVIYDRAVQVTGEADTIMPWVWGLMATYDSDVQWNLTAGVAQGHNIPSLQERQAQLMTGPPRKAVVEEIEQGEVLPRLKEGEVRCANCREGGHTIQDCVRVSVHSWHRTKSTSTIRGCPLCNELHEVDGCSKYQSLDAENKAFRMVYKRQGKPQVYTRRCIYDGGVLALLADHKNIVPPLSMSWCMKNTEIIMQTPYDYAKNKPFLKDPLVPDMEEVAFLKAAKYQFCVVAPLFLQAMQRELARALTQRARDNASRFLERVEADKLGQGSERGAAGCQSGSSRGGTGCHNGSSSSS
ncbi:hypothetical protein MCOR25_004904 [Pyricularia grisea]|nr:hypothetical protein MCOR25_004904 [Pyricularia grisea]